MRKPAVGQDSHGAETEWDVPRGWRGPTIRHALSTLPTFPQVEKLVERHEHRVAELAETIRAGHHRPGVSSTHTITIRVDEEALRHATEGVLTMLRSGEVASASQVDAAGSEEQDFLGNAVHLIDECLDLIVSSRLAAAKAVSAINGAYRCQDDFLGALHELGTIDGIAFAAYSNRLKAGFNATKLRLARNWLEHGRDDVDIGHVTKKLYRDVPGAPAVAAEIAAIVDTARDTGKLGNHPSTGDPVFVKVGPNGRMYVQLGRRSDTARKRALRIELPDRVKYEASDPDVIARSISRRGGNPNDVTFKMAVELIDQKRERLAPWHTDPKSGRPIFLRKGPYGLYLQLGRTVPAGGSGRIVRVSVPPDFDENSLTLDEASRLLHQRKEQDLPLGQDPESGQNVYVKDGRFGPFVQLGERKRRGPRVKIVDLPEGVDADDVDLPRALELLGRFQLRNLGPHPETGAAVTVQTEGRFGPFVSCPREHATVPERFDPMDVTLEQAVRFLAAKRDLMAWRRETRIEFGKAVSPPEEARLLRLKGTEQVAKVSETERGALLDRIEGVRARQLHLPRAAHRRGDISDEALERAIQFLDERLEEARRAVVKGAFPAAIE